MDLGSIAFLVPLSAAIALIVAVGMSASIRRRKEGTDEMRRISEAIREGASAYLRRQYQGVMLFSPLQIPFNVCLQSHLCS
jgi:K(+)-stimulated pyrophosphate-energized sodium pump